MKINFIKYVVLFSFIASLWACGTGYGIYHRVAPGETFDSICSAYSVKRATIARMNGILDSSSVKVGDALYIPGASTRIDSTRIAAASEKSKGYSSDNERPKKIDEAKTKKRVIKKTENKKKRWLSKKVSFIWPVNGKIVSPFGKNGAELHDGIDINGDEGNPIKAAASGRVIYSGNEIKGYGNMVIIKHEGRYSTVYAQNRDNLVKKGDFVKSGDVIAYVGNSGKIGTAVHFEIREGKVALDPLTFLP